MDKPIIEVYMDIITNCEKDINTLNHELKLTKQVLKTAQDLLRKQCNKEMTNGNRK